MIIAEKQYLPEEFRVGPSWRSKVSGGPPWGQWHSQADLLASSCRWRTPVPPCCYSPLSCAAQPCPFCGRSPTRYPLQLIGTAENLTSVVKSYKLSRLSKPWQCTRADAGKAAGELSGGQEGGRARIAPSHLINFCWWSTYKVSLYISA